ncbi:MAG: ribose-phosphate diphosphokinase [Fimbriimonadales bacterium]
MSLYAFDYAGSLADALLSVAPELRRSRFVWGRFANSELSVHLSGPAKGECLVLGSIQPPEDRLVTYLLLCDTLKRQGASRVTAVLPYLAYSRQDKREPGSSLAVAWVGEALSASGVDRVITLDLHSTHAAGLFPIPVESLAVAPLFADAIGNGGRDASIVSPDEGGVSRCEELRACLKATAPALYCAKQRTARGVSSRLVGIPGHHAIVYDDILDTGGTLLACCEKLNEAGTTEIDIVVTHGLFTGTKWRGLWNLGVRSITCTDAVPLTPPRDPRVMIISCAPVLASALRTSKQSKEFTHA